MKKARWIWENNDNNADEYVKFCSEFTYEKGDAQLEISCDSNYILYINGQLAAFGQYADYPHYKVYDKKDVTGLLKVGKNLLVAVVWYYGESFSTYVKGNAGFLYEISCGDTVLNHSSPDTLCRIADDFVCYSKKKITGQLGYSFEYDCSRYDGYDREGYLPNDYHPAKEVSSNTYQLHERPVKCLTLEEVTPAELIDEGKRIYDLKRECVGFLRVVFKAKKGERFEIGFGEHLADGKVRQKIGERDFSVALCGSGEVFAFQNCFRRLGARYLQVFAPAEVEIESIGVCETPYPLQEVGFHAGDALEQKIYATSVRTLRLCMHEHYEDCPWREQALYAMDSRNQMLCGYYAFREFEFARANLELMSKAQKADKLLPLCFPAGVDVPIPFFSLIYPIQMNEYADYSGDFSLLKEHLSLCEDIVSVFLSKIEANGLTPNLEGYWNFYEWSDGMDGIEEGEGLISAHYKKTYDLPLNCFLILALKSMSAICQKLGRKDDYRALTEGLQKAVFEGFYGKEKGIFKTYLGKRDHFSQLSNSLAVLAGCAFGNEREVMERVTEGRGMVSVTLAMKSFEYDALLSVSEDYAEFILREIRQNYGYMLDNGATSFWETILGECDFGGAGSLCHGWSALPVYYYHILKRK